MASFTYVRMHIRTYVCSTYINILDVCTYTYICTYVALDSKVVINHYYNYLEGHMDADSVSHMMHCKHLITDNDFEAITAAPNDNRMNTVLLQYVRAMHMSELISFCDVLKSIETQKTIGELLSTCKYIYAHTYR